MRRLTLAFLAASLLLLMAAGLAAQTTPGAPPPESLAAPERPRSLPQKLPHPQPLRDQLIMPPALDGFDVYDDTIRYDDDEVQWWFGGLDNFYLSTRFTVLANFNLQRVMVALQGSSSTPINLWVKGDVNGQPGPVLWSGTLVYNQSSTWMGVTLSTGSQYAFSAGQSFWVELFSAGPPYECFDESSTLPTRSYTNYPALSPGDNFIRAAGQYTSGVVDVAVDSVWHGGKYFASGSTTFPVGARVKNLGSSSATFTVACSLQTYYGTHVATVGSQNVTVAAGASANVTFPNFTYGNLGQYNFKVRATLSGDQNTANNWRQIETQIYAIPPAAELRYDDGVPWGGATIPQSGDGWAMKFNPNRTSAYKVSTVKFMTEIGSVNQAARVQVLADAGGSPGAVLWQTTQAMINGWNSFNPNVSVTGSFYLAYLYENGSNTAALNYDHAPSSGQAWSKVASGWISGASLNDWMIRAVIDTSGSGPSVTLDAGVDSVWHGNDFFCPNSGAYQVGARVKNYGSATATFTVACSLLTEAGAPLAAAGSQSVTLASGASSNVTFPNFVYGNAGTYRFRARAVQSGDQNPDNNAREIETQIFAFPPAAELRYDDGTALGAMPGSSVGDGAALKFDPMLAGSFRLTQVKASVEAATPGMARLQVLDDNGANAGPGSVLWEGTPSLSNGWNSLNLDLTHSGAFYVAYVYETGSASPGLHYDDAPQSGQGWKKSAGGAWSALPDLYDRFLRVVIDTVGSAPPPPPAVDAGVDSVWHGDKFFTPSPGTWQVGARVRNFGAVSANFAVACSLCTAAGSPLAAVGMQNVTVAAGASANVTFPNFTYPAAGLYSFRMRTLAAGDTNAANDAGEIETQVYVAPPAAELCYDDGAAQGPMPGYQVGGGSAMKFNPSQAGPYRITALKLSVETGAVNLPARLQVLDDNGADAGPGTILWEGTPTLSAGWNTLPLDLTHSGTFYAAYIYENGANSPSLGYDNPPHSGQGWKVSSGGWSALPDMYDRLLRVVIDTVGGAPPPTPDVWVDLYPAGSTALPSSGGQFRFWVDAGNDGTTPVTVDVWVMLTMPDGSVTGPVVGPFSDWAWNPGFSMHKRRQINIPSSYPPGTYSADGYVGAYSPSDPVIWAEDHQNFTKDGSLYGEGTGLALDLPEEFALEANVPNPFNPATSVIFALPQAASVRLEVYDLRGRRVALLADGRHEAGRYAVTFDGSALASGMYFARLQAGDFTAIQKMMLVK